MNMIERVARIVEAALERHGVTDFEGTTDDARAAIEAVREPTEAMLAVATALVDYDLDEEAINPSPADAYTAMIDAALEEGK